MAPALLATATLLLLGLGAALGSAVWSQATPDGQPPAAGPTIDVIDVPEPGPSSVAAEPTVSASASPTPGVSPRVLPRPTNTPVDQITAMENQVAALVNKARVQARCVALHTDERMRKAARRHSADMATYNYFSHTGRNGSSFVDRLGAAGYPKSKAAGENIAYGYKTAQAVFDAWMKSPGHRRNILNCEARGTGVGLAYRGRTAYWTQEFGRV